MSKRTSSKRNWYIATAIGCFMVPVGLVINIINTVIEYRHNKEVNTAIRTCAIASGIFALFLGGYPLFVWAIAAGELEMPLILSIAFSFPLIMSAYLFITYFALSHRCRRLSAVYSLIKLDHITSIKKMSEILGISREKTIALLYALKKMGYLHNANIDEFHNEVILTESVWAKQRVICVSCGAAITVDFGQTLICPYCGGALNVKYSQ